jgi:acyl dehydratase
MAVDSANVGRTYPPLDYEVGREKIREYANAVGEADPVHHDRDAAQAAGFRDVVAPPMFCVVYSAPAMGPALLDPALGIDFGRLLHGGQEFSWGEPVCAGDVIATAVSVGDIFERPIGTFYVLESTSTNQDGDEVVRGRWTNIVRGG